MPVGLQATKRRIRSVTSTKKITKAMELVATSKLKKTKNRFEEVKAYTEEIMNMVGSIMSKKIDTTCEYLKANDSDKTLYIVVTSSLGLCGGYNANVYKTVLNEIPVENSLLVVLGSKGCSFFKNRGYEIVEGYPEDSTGDEYEVARKVSRIALSKFTTKAVGKIKLVYTRYVNSVTFQPLIVDLLPVTKPVMLETSSENKVHKDTLFEPDATTILNTLIPMYFESSLYGKFVECHVSEQASRRMAMENASDNADEIIEQLQLQYNKARQSAITQEITEVVAGADA
jgi:F-type H+-transporting ATPase subunit gamma